MNDVLAFLTGLLAMVPGVSAPAPAGWSGYVEADYVYAAAPLAGTIEKMAVSEGQVVHSGDLLFVLDGSQQQAQLDAAAARAVAAKASLDNLKTGSRAEETDVTRAALARAKADLALATQNLQRTEDLFGQGLVPQAKLDQDRTSVSAAQAAVDQLAAQLKVQELPARDAQQIAAEASYAAAEADARAAQAALDRNRVVAPDDGRVDTLFFTAGEVPGAGVPVLSLVTDQTMKVLFYISETERQALKTGDAVTVNCDGCRSGLTARISHFAASPQFTPPVIYSRDQRERLVFATEAVMDVQDGILPGQPVSVALAK